MAGEACEEIQMDRFSKTYTVESKAVDPAQGIYECMISTEGVDRDGDVLLAMGCDTGAYMKNPVIFYGHAYFGASYPVAKTLSLNSIPGQGIKATFQFPPMGTSEQADTVHKLWAAGFLNAASVGFRAKPNGWQWRQDGNGEELARGRLFTDWELLEWSVVGVPANADALRLAVGDLVAKGYDREVVEELFGVKRGRVLSAKNEEKIRQAVAALKEVLASLSGDQPEGDGEEDSHDPENRKVAIPYANHGTADEGAAWSAPSLSDFTDKLFADLTDAEKKRIAAHFTFSANMPPESFGDMKLPHHQAGKTGVGPAVWRGVAAAMAALMGARGGVAMPEADKNACHSHLAKHYAQFDKEPPELREYTEEELVKLFPDVYEDVDPKPDISEPPIDESNEERDLEELSKILLQGLNALQEIIK